MSNLSTYEKKNYPFSYTTKVKNQKKCLIKMPNDLDRRAVNPRYTLTEDETEIINWVNNGGDYNGSLFTRQEGKILMRQYCDSVFYTNHTEEEKINPKTDIPTLENFLTLIFGKDSDLFKKYNHSVNELMEVAINYCLYSINNTKLLDELYVDFVDFSNEAHIKKIEDVFAIFKKKFPKYVYGDWTYAPEGTILLMKIYIKFNNVWRWNDNLYSLKTVGIPYESDSDNKEYKWVVSQLCPSMRKIVMLSYDKEHRKVLTFDEFNKMMSIYRQKYPHPKFEPKKPFEPFTPKWD